MNSGWFKNVHTNYSLTNCVYKQDFALNNPQGLICHITQPNQSLVSILSF